MKNIGLLLATLVAVPVLGNFNQDVSVTWGDGRGQILNNGQLVALSLDRTSGSGFQSNNQFLYGWFQMQIKLVPRNSAGTVTAYYLKSDGSTWDEIDLEFLGNATGEPYVLHTNIFSQGKGNREQQFYLWFDPRADFHNYSVIWNPSQIFIYVDGTPIREYKNLEGAGVPYPKSQAMRLYGTLWDAEDWATRGGLVKTDWSQAPFTASFRNFNYSACVWNKGASSCPWSVSPTGTRTGTSWYTQQLSTEGKNRMKWVQQNYMIYNYCNDPKRFPQGLPLECTLSSNPS
ncbi:hypothetical protein MLD38_006734 [Melastoma candidum]|uniref:Uncharacterized protein n=1 Tax=Melastoma candidum TaxID=119954 RepID=A0ACB9RXA8_9MYRT|nr:hypothetical protein MLD38_006734 [Melastoma candidum]